MTDWVLVGHFIRRDTATSWDHGWACTSGSAGPISDQFVRKAYVAAYDRRLRHPAWVRPFLLPCPPLLSKLSSSIIHIRHKRPPNISLSLPSVNPHSSLHRPTAKPETAKGPHSRKTRASQFRSARGCRIISGVDMIGDICELFICGSVFVI